MATNPTSETAPIPQLQPGDALTRDEFERRYQAMPDCKKAELIEGVVYMPSPTRFSHHAKPHSQLITWLGVYAASTPGVMVADNGTNRLDMENEPQPDCMMFIAPELGGQVRISDDDYITGPPEFVAEVSSASLAVDRGPKLRTFLRSGIQEYLIWRVDDQSFEWYRLRNSRYEMLEQDTDGYLKSEIFPGLWLDMSAMLQGQMAQALQVLQQGVQSDRHAEFVRKLGMTQE